MEKNEAEEMIKRNFESKRRALNLLLEAAKLLEESEREDNHYGY